MEPQEQAELRRLLNTPELAPIRNALLTAFAVESMRAKDKIVSELCQPEPNLLRAVRYAKESDVYSQIFTVLDYLASKSVQAYVEDNEQ